MLWTILILSLYSLGRSLSAQEMRTILSQTTPSTGSKRKNTYLVKPAFFHKFKILTKFNTIPVRVVSINGHQVRNPFYALNLPGKVTHQLASELPQSKTYQITEYLDKYTLEPVLTLLPNMKLLPSTTNHATLLARLNHASRRDLIYRIKTK